MAQASMYVRAKRGAQTVFMYCEPSDTVAHLKAKLGAVLGRTADSMKLVLKEGSFLEDNKTLSESGVENDCVLYFCLKNPSTGQFEGIIKPDDHK
eukprot:m51a1_g782 hypothetical protein (95) ;mRNA; r:618992-619443